MLFVFRGYLEDLRPQGMGCAAYGLCKDTQHECNWPFVLKDIVFPPVGNAL